MASIGDVLRAQQPTVIHQKKTKASLRYLFVAYPVYKSAVLWGIAAGAMLILIFILYLIVKAL